MKKRIVVVGNGMVGHKFIDNLVNHADAGQYQVITFSEEPRLAYDRVQLSKYFSGSTAEDLALTTADYYNEKSVEFILKDKVIDLDFDNKEVITVSGRREAYDKLILATGSFPFVPPIPGNNGEHCLVYRTIEDLEAITHSATQSKIGVVVGGGLLGLEAAAALKAAGLETHVVEFAPRLMAVQLDEGGGKLLRRKIETIGVKVHTQKATNEIVAGTDTRYRMNFADGSYLETDMILFSAGIRPQDELARKCGIQLGERGGIVVDNNCQTNMKDVYAIGECALWNNRIYGLVAPGYQMAKVAVSHITGGSDQFMGADMSTKLKLLGVDVASIGDAHGITPGSLSYTYSNDVDEVYKRMIVSADNKKLLGAVLVGDVEAYGTLQQICVNGMDLPDDPNCLILPNVDGGGMAIGVDALPETAMICSCYDVSKGAICCSVQNGARTMGDIKAITKASTGCGGCTALTKQVMDSELKKLGVEVSNHICEHFPHSRQELADIIRIKKIKTFDDLLDSHGNGGLGCEICKPAVGSILAGFWNEFVLDKKHIGLQDTNDIFLGNMQKDGTYSIVPRVAGGEITPDKLIVLGQVAKQYNLYTKITGGQRIDLFGAQLHQLPAIWKVLVDAGFETGHAYGKSLRTVKSCVGSTWCRYGVLDSVGMAITLENRYKGVRAPHKIKFGVSGCTRECAEAQSKDFGVIATETGWSLYVCGNGGMRPRHADLFATGLDDVTLIKYVDRVMMFYIRTGDRLQRTSVWMENMEGGLDYLKKVVIDDKLSICAELEAQMAYNISQYQCEWKTTVESDELQKRFKHFINTSATDDNLAYVVEREQIRPATALERSNKSIQFVELVD